MVTTTVTLSDVKTLLSHITTKRYISIMRRGNVAIRQALRIAKEKGFSKLLLQDQGGWITYEQYAKQLKLEIQSMPTDVGLFSGNYSDSLLLLNTMPSYASLLDTTKISVANGFVINDATGSIGTSQGTWGDIIVASFGEDKPVYMGKFALFASDIDYSIPDEIISDDELIQLYDLINRLSVTRTELITASQKIKHDLKEFNIVHPQALGFNVIIRTTSDEEENTIKEYCTTKGYEFTICPRYIRMLDRGISIEVKRVVKQN